MAGIGDLLGGGDVIRQILVWQVLGELLSPILAPVAQDVANEIWPGDANVPVSPADAAAAVVRGELTHDQGAAWAARSGTGREQFNHLVAISGEPPGLEQLLFAWRRGIIDQGRLEHGIRQSRVKDEWIDVVEALRTVPIAPADAVAAAVQSQIDYGAAAQIAYEGGLAADGFDLLVRTRGRPPGPAEVTELVRRGVVPADGTGPDVLSLEQAIRESDIKNKWIPAYRSLLEYRPPPRTVTALLRAGSITQERALELFKEAGLTQEMAAAYVADASHQKLAPDHLLAKGVVTQLYSDRLVDRAQATTMLGQLHYNAAESQFILALVDMQRTAALVRAATTKIGQLFIARKIEKQAASNALDALRVPGDQRDYLLTVWGLERGVNLRIISEATVAAVWKHGTITDDEAMAELVALGYTAFDAWLYLAAHNKGAGPGPKPARDATHGVL